MRARTRWHRGDRARSPGDVASAAAFTAFRLSRSMLENLRRARFAIDAGPAYFEFLAEALAFCIQCACRVAWPRLADGEREAFATALAQHAAGHLAENEAGLLGRRSAADAAHAFIARLNERFAEYAELEYGPDGPHFGFLRYFASLVADIVPPEDARWVHDQVIAIEGPVAAATLARTLTGLLEAR